ncbi:MAG: 3-methylitaconate isomerase [Alphaproteobacteria bacterium]|nr:3-methylitaconate isomerase [Alphaproteobacteria bacterium]
MSKSVPCVILRGGTSKGVYLKEADLPTDPDARERLILSIFGSPDKRQIDGLGGADPLTSKVCIIGPPPKDNPRAEGAHLSYTFGQVEIDAPSVDFRSLCGNLTSGVGAFAIWEGMVEPVEPVTPVRIYNTNLDRMLIAEVPVRDGRPQEDGDYAIPGVPGTGAPILVDFADTADASTGALLPTGNAMDRLDVPGLGVIDASMVDIGNAHVFVRAQDLGMTGTETAAEIDANKPLVELLEKIRAHAGVAMGMIDDPDRATETSPATPFVAMIAPPKAYENVIGENTVLAEEVDFVSRLMFMQQMHKTYAGTSTACTGIASRIPGTIVYEACRPETRDNLEVRIGHPAGVITTEAKVELDGNNYAVKRATLGRTARRIMEGRVYVP